MEEQAPGGCIILAEDSATNRKILTHLLEKMGFVVEAYENGAEAWKALETKKHQKDLLAIITDIMMPEMDGIELLKKVRTTPEFEKLPVIIASAVSDKRSILEAKDHHVTGYLLKPVTQQKLMVKLKELFPNHKFPSFAA